ncbi:MAG: nicotinate (nicotinamide) nucleotide adenylyltransferase [Acidobacteria bacterium]|nr:nicotinate (nicotinamide) nucleotide adenylyltransferase [Acidobacteriota bacterium]
MSVAFFGGTFDPPHRGHIGVARAAAKAFDLSAIFFAPVGNQPLKPGLTATPFEDRLAMVTLACEECQPETAAGKQTARFIPSAIDAPQPDHRPNYTVDTLEKFRREMPAEKLYCLVGADSFLSLRQWREPDRLLELAEWIVVSRPGHSLADLSSLTLTPQQRERVHLIETAHFDISSTWLRERLSAGDSARDLLPESVARYIRDHHLYRLPSNAGG